MTLQEALAIYTLYSGFGYWLKPWGPAVKKAHEVINRTAKDAIIAELIEQEDWKNLDKLEKS